MRIAVLASGSGTNLQALLDHYTHNDYATGRVVWVGSNRADAGALVRAQNAGVAANVVDRHTDGAALLRTLEQHQVDILVLAGYLKLVPVNVVRAFHGRMLNIHPALLPAFGGAGMYGARVHEAVIASGATVSGPTVHFVDEHYDRGAIIAQWPVPVRPGDTPASLAERVLRVEHVLLPFCVDQVATGRVSLDASGQRVVSKVAPANEAPLRYALLQHGETVPDLHELALLYSPT